MAGAPTRFGFAGGEAPPDPRSSPTLHGHDLHVTPPASAAVEPEVPLVAPPMAAAAPAAADAGPLTPVPPHTGKSNYPTVARLFGRWGPDGQLVTDQGEPAPLPEADDAAPEVDSLFVPRERLVPRWVLVALAVVLVALAAVALAGLLLRGRRSAVGVAPAAPTRAALLAAPVAPPIGVWPPTLARQEAERPPMQPGRTTSPRPRAAAARQSRSDGARRRRPTRGLSDEPLPPSF